MSEDNEELEHPALKNFSEGAETAKHIAKKTIKGGLIGAAIGGIGVPALIALAGTVGLAASGPVGWLVGLVGGGTAIGTGAAATALGAVAMNTAIIGGVAGAAVGGVTGAIGADEAVDARKEEVVAQADRMQVRQEQAQAIALDKQNQILQAQRQQAGFIPTQGLPQKATDGAHLG